MYRFARPGWPLTALPSCLGWSWHLDCLDRPSTHGIEGHGYVLQVTRKLEDQPLQFPCVISGLEATLVERHFGLVPLSVAHRCTDADILEQQQGIRESAHQQRMQGLDRAYYTMHVLPL